jgi:DnaJ-class molecular chaperone
MTIRHKYYVVARKLCQRCEGQGRINPPGFAGLYSCPDCNGTGKLESWVPLIEALRELGVGGVYVE